MGTYVAMIPARLGSKRVEGKNLRLLAGRPLVSHVAEQCRKAGVFDEIYINSEAEIFDKIANESGVRFYKRDPRLATDDATNDEFALDFMNHIPCDILAQINPTSPLIRYAQIQAFMRKMVEGGFDALLSVKEEQVEGYFKEKPINFDPLRQMPRSQDLIPIQLHCSCVLAWKTDAFRRNIEKYNAAVYGADGKVGYFVFDKISALDIDNEDDFIMVEMALELLSGKHKKKPQYYEG